MTTQKIQKIDEAVTVQKRNYSWGRMITVQHGKDTSYPLHPEHQQAIKGLKPGQSVSFVDETNRRVKAERDGNIVHLSARGSNTKTPVAYTHFTESVTPTFRQLRDNLFEKTLTAAEKKKREEVAKAIERDNPNMPVGMKMAIATKTAKRVAEDVEQIDELAGANMDTRALHAHLKKKGWVLTRTAGSHDVFTHQKATDHLAIPRHKQLKLPLIHRILKTAETVTEDVEQIDELKKSTLKNYMGKAVDPVYGIPKTLKNFRQRLKGISNAQQRIVGSKPTSKE